MQDSALQLAPYRIAPQRNDILFSRGGDNITQSILSLEAFNGSGGDNAYRTIFKTRHGRSVYLEVEIDGENCNITDCFYTDRNRGKAGAARYSARPKLLRTRSFPTDQILTVIESELDKRFYGVEFVPSGQAGLSPDEYLQYKSENEPRKYRFLVMIGEGDSFDGLPVRLRTRLKTSLHRSVYVELAYYKDGNGVVRECSYYDRGYARQNVKVTPPSMVSVFFPYSRSGILDLVNHELCCNFTHIIVTSGIDIDSDTTPLCGSV